MKRPVGHPGAVRGQRPALSRSRGERGFALVIAVVLLAFLVVVLVALAQFSRVETRRAQTQNLREQARQHALVGLNVALGRLQAAAGSDQRVSATAELVGARNPHWTGIWDTTDLAHPPIWLVSGRPANSEGLVVTAGAARTGVTLVGENSAGAAGEARVDVLLENIDVGSVPGLPGPQTIGRFAFWVGDEGVKGGVTATDRVDQVRISPVPDPLDPVRDATQRARLRQLFAHRAGNDAEAGFGIGDEDTDLPRWQALEPVIMGNQLRFGFADTSARRAYLREHYHDFTVQALGLLANTARGGLRTNWSAPDAVPAWGADFDRPHDAAALLIDPGTAPIGGRSAQIKPVVTEWALDVIIARGSVGANAGLVGVGYRLRVELWNPFPGALRNGAGADLVVSFSGLPVLDVSVPGWRGTVDLNTLIAPIPLDLGGDLPAGEIRVVEAPVVQFVPSGLAAPDLTPADPADDILTVGYAGAPGSIRCTMVMTAPAAAAPALFRLAEVPFALSAPRTVSPWSFPGDQPFPPGDPGANLPAAGIRFHVRATTTRVSWADWIDPATAPRDLRANDFVFRPAEWESVNGDAVLAASAAVFAPGDPVFAAGRPLVVSDFSLQRNLSVGALHHTSAAFGAPQAIGSPWGGEENRIFDEACFNPVPSSWIPGEILPNTRHRVLVAAPGGAWPAAGDLRGAGAARWLGVEGALNVNSVSARAWNLALGRTVRGWTDAGGAPVNLENPFFYFAQSAPLATDPPRGRRVFGDAAIRTLADALRNRILTRGRPFASLQDFVNSGLLQAAIDDAGLNTGAAFCTDIGGPPARYSPDFLTQAVVLQTVAPVLAARSDTFTIRAYGEVVNPALAATEPGAIAGRAWCEAVVQRLPEYVDPAEAPGLSPPSRAENRLFGRRFRVVAFRWLTADDI